MGILPMRNSAGITAWKAVPLLFFNGLPVGEAVELWHGFPSVCIQDASWAGCPCHVMAEESVPLDRLSVR
jgi:hypothetical protein